MNIKTIVKNNTVQFRRLRQGVAWYGVVVPDAGYYEFPVPIEDIGEATLNREDKAIYFMRYIRKALETGSFVPA